MVNKDDKKEESIPQGGNETILIVDDEELVRELGEQILSKFGYNVITAIDGESALDIYREKKEVISLVILDLIMPGMGGKKCLKEILSISPDINIVIASGYSSDSDSKTALGPGAKGFINKPYDVRQMLSKVREILDA